MTAQTSFGPYEKTLDGCDPIGKERTYLLVPPADFEAMQALIARETKRTTQLLTEIERLQEMRSYFIIKRPDWIPEVKRAAKGGDYEMAKELIALYPDANVFHLKVSYHDLWIDTAQDFIVQHEAFESLAEMEQAQANKDNAVLADIKKRFGKKFSKAVVEYLADGEDRGYYEIVEKPVGTKRTYDLPRGISHVFVNQYLDGGMEGDSFEGNTYIPLPDGKFLKTHYSM